MSPKKLTTGDSVIVKFEPGTVGYRNQGAGWHSAKINLIFTSGYMILLDNPTQSSKYVFEPTGTPVYSLNSKGHIDKEFYATVIRKVS